MISKLFTVDLTGIGSESEIHERLAGALALPDWYGKNMDALHDCLTAFSGRIIVRGTADAIKNLPEAYQLFRRVCRDSMNENPNLWMYFVEPDDQ